MLSQIRDLCKEDPSREVCGVVLLHTQSNTVSVIPVPNTITAPSAAVEFEMDPAVWAQMQREVRRGASDDYELIYRFHSHPFGMALPSPTDIGAARYPEREIIYSVSYNTFFCYAPKAYADDHDFNTGPIVGANEVDQIVACELTEYTQTLPSDYGSQGIYADFHSWRRRYW